MEPTLTYSLAFGRSRIELHPGVLLVAAPARGIPERRIELSTLRHFCIDPIQIMTLLQKLTMDFDAAFVVSWGPDGAVEHLRIAVNRQAPDLRALLAALAEQKPNSSLLHLSPEAALRRMGVPSRDRDVAIVLGVLLIGALAIAGIILWMLRGL